MVNLLNKVVIFLIFYILIIQTEAKAYIDPGTGSMVMQIVAAIIGAIGYYFTISFKKIRSFFSKNDNK